MDFSESHQPQGPAYAEMQIPEYCSNPLSPSKPERKNHNRARPLNSIPRPPNCFLLFRKDFLDKGIIPPDVESKQHNLSRIAADCWKRLPDSERHIWIDLSKLKTEEHMKAHPDYQYKPKKRDVPVQKRKRATTTDEELAHCRNVREIYVPAATGPVVQASTSKPPRQRKSRARRRDEDDYLPTPRRRARPRESPRNTSDSPVFMSPLLPPQTGEKVSHPSMDTALVSPAFPDVAAVPSTEPDTEDDWNVQPAPILVPVPLKPPYNAAIHIRENYEISRRGAIAPTVNADYQDAQAWYNPQPFFAPPGNAQRTHLPPMSTSCRQAPHSSLVRSFPCPTQIGPVFNASPSASSSHDPSLAPKDFVALPGSAEPQPFPITLRSSASTPPNSVVLRPPQFDATPGHLETLTISFDERTLEDFSAGLGIDDQFDLFGQPPSALRLGSDLESTFAWSSRMMIDVLSQEVCSRKV